MKPVHIVADKTDIAPRILLPGDPLRAKYIAENFLSNVKLINSVRNMLGFTGEYKGKKVTVIGSGMGIPSVSLYTYELYKFYDVENIIRIGTAGSLDKEIHIRDIVLSTSAYSDSNFAYAFSKSQAKVIDADSTLNDTIIKKSDELMINLKVGPIYTSEVFDVYASIDHLLDKIDTKLLACEMEGFGLFHIAKTLNKKATGLISIVDSKFETYALTTEEREKDLNDMIVLALESIIKY